MMKPLVFLFVTLITMAAAYAEEPAAASSVHAEDKTLKERLGDKSSDEQRVDDCNVPVDRRGSKARPDTCPH